MDLRCDKRAFSSRPEAIEAMMGMKQDRKSKVKHGSVYHCEGCNAWHITTKKKKNYPVVTTSETKFRKDVDRQNENKSRNKTLIIKNFSSKPIR